MEKQTGMIPGRTTRRSKGREKNLVMRRAHAFKNSELTPFKPHRVGPETPGA
jgi:hypothetical protein